MSQGGVKLSPDKTWIPIGVAVAGLIAFVATAFTAGSAYNQILTNQASQNESLKRLEIKLDQWPGEYVSVRGLKQWIEILKLKNPGHDVPDYPR